MKIKKFLKNSLLFLLILLNCSWTSVPVSSVVNTSIGTHSTCDEDITELGIDVSNYSDYDYSLIFFAEVDSKYLIIYMYDDYENFNYDRIDLNYSQASSETSLDLVKSTQIRRELELLSTSSDGLVKKFLINDIDVSSYLYRRYVINQIISSDKEDNSETYKTLTIGSQYTYHTYNGSVYYYSEDINYVTIENQKVYNFNIKADNTHLNGWRFLPSNGSVGNRYSMIGFSASQLDIDRLEEVEVLFDKVVYQCYTSTDDVSLPEVSIYTEENVASYNETNGTDWEFISEYEEIISAPIREDCDVTITPSEITANQIINDNWIKKTSRDVVWDSIMIYDCIDDFFPEDDYPETNELMKESFDGCDYIITFYEADPVYFYNEIACGFQYEQFNFTRYDGFQLENDFYRYMYWNDYGTKNTEVYQFNLLLHTNYYYRFTGYQASNAEIVRLKYLDSHNNEFDVKVISSPVDSAGNIGGDDSSSSDNDFWETLKFIIIVILIVVVLALLIPIISPFIPVVISAIGNVIRLIFHYLIVAIKYIFNLIKLGVLKIGKFISSIFHR